MSPERPDVEPKPNGNRRISFRPEYVADRTNLIRPMVHTGWLEDWPPGGRAEQPDRTKQQRRGEARPSGIQTAPHTPRPTTGAGIVDDNGGLQLAPAQAERLGLTPGTRLIVTETPDGIVVRRADPALTRVYVEPTAACNLNCRTCVRHSWQEPLGTMTMATYEALIAGLRSIPTLRTMAFWGIGEPLLHRDLPSMIAMAKALGVETEIITNAQLLDRELAERLVTSGLDRLVVSIDSTTASGQADIRSGADLNQIVENLETLHAIRVALDSPTPVVGMEFVAMRSNLHELPKLRRFSYSIGASFIVVTNLLPYTEEMNDQILYGLWAGRSYTNRHSGYVQDVRLPRMDARGEALLPIVQLLEHPGVLGLTPDNPHGGEGYCRFVNEGTLAVGWNGDVSPCIALMHSYRCYVLGREKWIKRYAVGNVAETPVGEIWARDEYVRFRDRVRRFDFSPCTNCGSCTYAETNEEDCFGNSFPVCGDCLWAKGVIQCP